MELLLSNVLKIKPRKQSEKKKVLLVSSKNLDSLRFLRLISISRLLLHLKIKMICLQQYNRILLYNKASISLGTVSMKAVNGQLPAQTHLIMVRKED